MLYNRIVSAMVLISMSIAMIFFSSLIQFSIFVLIVCLISSWEWGKLMKFSVAIHYIWMFFMFSVLCSSAIAMITRNCLFFNDCCIFFSIFGVIMTWWLFVCVLVLFYPDSVIFWNKYNILRFCFGILMIVPVFFGTLILRQFHYFNDYLHGKWWLFSVLTLTWVNDSSAYFIGKKLGRHKLLQSVSPKKTWEGCIGGFSVSAQLAWIFSKYILVNVDNHYYRYAVFISYIGALMFAIVGDLVESMFKRESGVKDISNLIPGHGGLLDRIDSLMFSIPVFTMLMLLFIHINNVFEVCVVK